MSLEDIKEALRNLLPPMVDEALVENLALQSSHIIFEQKDEFLFRAGDLSKGFYWVLSGQVVEKVSDKISVLSNRGAMVGLEELLEKRKHISDWCTTCKTEVLFIDSRCFKNFKKLDVGGLVSEELAHRLVQLKAACQSNPSVLIRPA
ncbi:cyclic nucleotide-binding domain-containing protein [Owenweeksia hongkongensis]|uniref:cyclic nucleotide-binding domain-containing protein n=1 Tax=Owenweeksia hongkongensis TaxID=253245 RepID=UPI003A8FBB78